MSYEGGIHPDVASYVQDLVGDNQGYAEYEQRVPTVSGSEMRTVRAWYAGGLLSHVGVEVISVDQPESSATYITLDATTGDITHGSGIDRTTKRRRDPFYGAAMASMLHVLAGTAGAARQERAQG